MHFGRVTGSVVASTKTPGLLGRRLLLVAPADSRGERVHGAALVAADTVSAAPGQWVLVVRAREAAHALPDKSSPVDAAIVAIVDEVSRPPAAL